MKQNTMKKPDRFATMATMLRLGYQASPWIDEGNKWAALEQRVEKLLRRQHAAYVRMVRRIGDTVEAGASGTSAINTVLAALEKYRQGTR